LLAISIVLVASLTLGRQILHWWHAAPPAPTAAVESELAGPAWDDELQPLSLEFGDLPLALTRQVVIGERSAAIDALVRHCQSSAAAAECPPHEPDAAELQLLAKIAGLTPVVQPVARGPGTEKPSDWRVYVVDERFTLVAAVRRFSQGPQQTASEGSRLVCWGIAMPAREHAWTLFVFRGAVAGSSSSAGRLDVPLPPGAQRNLSFRDERGGSLIGFSGSGSPQVWMAFYDDWFSTRGWSNSGTWSSGAESWSARFSKPGVPGAAFVEIRFAADGKGTLTGILDGHGSPPDHPD
jgi:hypothetical protein